MELLPRLDDAPAFNAAIRVLTPTAYIILIATILYEVGAGAAVANIYMVAVIYVVFRWMFNIIWDRTALLNWAKEWVLGAIIILINWVVNQRLLVNRSSLLPESNEIINQIWILMGLYLFYVLNQIRIGDHRTIQRKHRYVGSVAERFRVRFSSILSNATDNEQLRALILAVAVYENFNRPRTARLIENAVGHLGRSGTFGLMQVSSAVPIDDRESMIRGVEILVKAWNQARAAPRSYNPDREVALDVLKGYNPDDDYIYEVLEVWEIILKRLYPGTQFHLADQAQVDEAVG